MRAHTGSRAVALCLIAVLTFLPPAIGQQASKDAARPVWMMPPWRANGEAWRQLFENPLAWVETRKHIQVIGCADHNLNRQFTDSELRKWLPLLQQWGIKFGLEVGAIKEWGPTGEQAFAVGSKMWDRFEALGGKISALAMDEPLCCTRQSLKKPDAYAIEQTARFVQLVHQKYPDVSIGDVEPYPFLSRTELLAFVDGVNARLKSAGVRGLDFLRLDVDWNHFTIGNSILPGNWPDVHKLEQECRQRLVRFSLIYWDADYDRMKQLSLADDSSWYIGIMRQGADYAFVDGSPDEYVVESWVDAPSRSIPDSEPWTFTRSVLDFCKKYVERKPH